jgi:hypothetical protein
MNILNRILVILLLLGLLVVLALLAGAPAETLGVATLAMGNLHGLAVRLLPAGRALVGLTGVGLALLVLFVLWLEIRRPSQRTVRVRQSAGASAEVTTQTLRERVEIAVAALPGVVSAAARARSYGRSVEVWVETEIAPDIQVAPKADEIAAAVRHVTETTMGLALQGKPHIRIRAVRLPPVPSAEPVLPAPTMPVAPPPAAMSKEVLVFPVPEEMAPEPPLPPPADEPEPVTPEPSR